MQKFAAMEDNGRPSSTARKQLSVQTLLDFKRNCCLLESALSQDHVDPIADLQKLNSWFQWIDGGNGMRPPLQVHTVERL